MVLRPSEGQTYEQRFCGTWYDCKNGCSSSILLQSPELIAQNKEMFAQSARKMAKLSKDIKAAFAAWNANEAYWDGKGFRLKADRRRRAAWSSAALKLYPSCDLFHAAAKAVA